MNEYNIKDEEEKVIDLCMVFCDFWKGLKKFWWLLLILCSLTAGGSYVLTVMRYSPMYESKVSFTVSTKMSYDESNTSYGFYYNQSTAEQLADVFPYILHSDIMNEIIQDKIKSGRANGSVDVQAIPKSNLFTMKAVSSEPMDAKELLEVTLKYLPDVTKYVIGETKLNIIQPVTTPDQPYNRPDYRKNVVKGMLLGILMSGVLLVVYALFRKTIRKEDEFREVLNIKCLGTVPQVHFKAHNKQIDHTVSVLNERTGSYFKESIRSIALRVQRRMDENKQKVLLITSTLSDEGKSMLAVNIALALQERGKKVLLMDMDLRNPTLADYFGIKDFVGIGSVLRESHTIEQGIQRLDQGIYFMGEKETVEKVTRLLTRPVLQKIIERLRDEMDYIIMDAPPCGIVSDAITISDVCDEILYVVRQDQVKHSQAIDAVSTVVSHGVPVLGGVLNGVEHSAIGYGYGYGYGKYGYGKYGKYGEK